MQLPGVRRRTISEEKQPPPQGVAEQAFPRLRCYSRSLGSECECTDGEAAKREGISREDFEVFKLLGRGGFGEVKLVKYIRNGQLYAMKALDKASILERKHVGDCGARGRVQVERDIGVLAHCWECPFIVELHATFQTHGKLYFVFDYCPQGDLFQRMLGQEGGRFEEPAARFYLAEVCLALEHLHAHDAIHRDVKLENVLLASDGHVKLGDFGIAKMNLSAGTRPSFPYAEGSALAFYPPEFRQGEAYGKDLDCWQLGVAAFLMLSGHLPELDAPLALPGATKAASNLCAQLLEPVRLRRLGHPSGACQLRDHDFFKDVNWQSLKARAVQPPAGEALQIIDTGSPAWSTPYSTEKIRDVFRLSRFSFVGAAFWGRRSFKEPV